MTNRVRMHAKPCLKHVPVVRKSCQTAFFVLESVSNRSYPDSICRKRAKLHPQLEWRDHVQQCNIHVAVVLQSKVLNTGSRPNCH